MKTALKIINKIPEILGWAIATGILYTLFDLAWSHTKLPFLIGALFPIAKALRAKYRAAQPGKRSAWLSNLD